MRMHDVGHRARVRRRSRCAGASREKEGEREIATWMTETERDQMSLTREREWEGKKDLENLQNEHRGEMQKTTRDARVVIRIRRKMDREREEGAMCVKSGRTLGVSQLASFPSPSGSSGFGSLKPCRMARELVPTSDGVAASADARLKRWYRRGG